MSCKQIKTSWMKHKTQINLNVVLYKPRISIHYVNSSKDSKEERATANKTYKIHCSITDTLWLQNMKLEEKGRIAIGRQGCIWKAARIFNIDFLSYSTGFFNFFCFGILGQPFSICSLENTFEDLIVPVNIILKH